MNVVIKKTDKAQLVEVSGTIDGKTSPEIQTKLLGLVKEGGNIVLDMSKVEFMASAGLRILLAVRRQLPAGGSFILTGLSEHIQETMSVTGFIDFFTCFDTTEQALASL